MLSSRIAYFAEHGCRASDHGLSTIPYTPCSEEEADRILKLALAGKTPQPAECDAYRTALMLYLAEEYTKRDWVMEIHYGVLRNINTEAFRSLGPDTGFDAAGDAPAGTKLAALLNAMEERKALPKTILFSIKESDNELLNTIAGSFQRPGTAGRSSAGRCLVVQRYEDGNGKSAQGVFRAVRARHVYRNADRQPQLFVLCQT